MRQRFFSLMSASTIAVLVAGCGGSSGNFGPKIQFSSQVVFGDSLSDVGTYAVGGVAALGGGRYTVNSMVGGALGKTNWTELMATTLNLPAPCAAETGLNGSIYNTLIVVHTPGCTNYAQGGAMVTYPYGPGNATIAAVPNGNPVDGDAELGQLTVPVVTQIQNHLAAHGGSFKGTEIVFVGAGGNDAIFNTYLRGFGFINEQEAMDAMSLAGTQLAGYVNNLILANGAKYVVVLNLPDLSTTPFGTIVSGLLGPATVPALVHNFNNALKAGLTSPNVLMVDSYTTSVDQIANPRAYGLSNVTDMACNLDTAVNLLGSSLTCNSNNVVAGDVSHYLFADQVHPTPYGNELIASHVASQMAAKGWL